MYSTCMTVLVTGSSGTAGRRVVGRLRVTGQDPVTVRETLQRQAAAWRRPATPSNCPAPTHPQEEPP